MVNSLFLFLVSVGCGLVGGLILFNALRTGSFSGLADQILMMTSLIGAAVFLTGAVLSDSLRAVRRELVRQRKSLEKIAREGGLSRD
jgi:hypothetical protein